MAKDTTKIVKSLASPAVGAAVLVLVFYLALTGYLIAQVGTDETSWTRLSFLYGGLEAVVFAAAGALFGSTFQVRRANKAEERAEKTAEEAEDALAEREVLRAVEAEMRMVAEADGVPPASTSSSGLSTEKVGDSVEPGGTSGEGAFASRLLRLGEEIRISQDRAR